jgi:peptidoglycan/LPS O-acetylase OafA/YrhL
VTVRAVRPSELTLSVSGPPHRRMFGLDLMRAVAITGVVATHARIFVEAFAPGVRTLPLGTFGVELFFVLSGFLIGGILCDSGEDLGKARALFKFWYRRWMRTLPNYVLFLAINLAWFGWIVGPNPPTWQYLTFTQNFAWPPPLAFDESWSLAVEEWFYLLFPLVLFALTPLLGSRRAVLVGAVVFLVAPTALRSIAVEATNPAWDAGVRKVVLFRLDALMYGVLGAWLMREAPALWHRIRRPAAAIGGVLLMSLAGYFIATFPGGGLNSSMFARTSFFSVLAFAFACLLPAASEWRVARETAVVRGVRLVALWSYAWYLVHPRVMALMTWQLGPRLADARVAVVAGVLFVFASLLISAAVYHWYERPIMNLRDRRQPRRTSAVLLERMKGR